MNRYFYLKLATNNIRKNSKAYIPYILTCIGIIIMFYNMSFLSVSKELGRIGDSKSLRFILSLGENVVGIFSVIFLFYINSFLIKQRKREFGLFNILGMEKKHISQIMFYETALIMLLCIISGLAGGILFSKLMILLLLKIIYFKVGFGFEIPASSVGITILLFCGIFLLNLIYNIFQVHLSKPVELLKGGNVGEKEPKTKWLMALIGVVTLGIAYFIALTTESPLAALARFFIAVILVIIGTYCLFTAGSIAILKILRSNKKYYYKLKHFTSVSGMIYRMKQNAAGLSNICILSTAVIVTLSTTVALYVGVEDVLRTRFPRNIAVEASKVSDKEAEKLDFVIQQQIDKAGITKKNIARYRTMEFVTIQNGKSFITSEYDQAYSSSNYAVLIFMTHDEYNKIEANSDSLSGNETLLYSPKGDIPGDIVNFNGMEFSIKGRLTSLDTDGILSNTFSNTYYFVVKDLDAIKKVYTSLTGKPDGMGELSYHYGFDVDADSEVQISLTTSLRNAVSDIVETGHVDGAESSRENFYLLYGGLFYIGIFLGLLFIMATVLIIYYKQISEGYDDRERFKIMQKVGMSREEVKKSIRSQVLTVFFLPLITAVIHLAFAFKVITKLLAVLNLTNVPLFAVCTVVTIIIFAVFYTIVYMLTAKTYYKIVS